MTEFCHVTQCELERMPTGLLLSSAAWEKDRQTCRPIDFHATHRRALKLIAQKGHGYLIVSMIYSIDGGHCLGPDIHVEGAFPMCE